MKTKETTENVTKLSIIVDYGDGRPYIKSIDYSGRRKMNG